MLRSSRERCKILSKVQRRVSCKRLFQRKIISPECPGFDLLQNNVVYPDFSILTSNKYKDFLFHFFKFLFIYFNWRLIILQYCGGFCHALTWISHWYTCVPPRSPSHPPGLSQGTGLECPASSIEPGLVICFHMIICTFQRYSLKSSHPRLLPQSPKLKKCFLLLL